MVRAGGSTAAGSRAVMRCVFDERFGYPRLYNRTVLGASLDVPVTTETFGDGLRVMLYYDDTIVDVTPPDTTITGT